MIGILQRGDLPCSFVSPEVICEGGGSVRWNFVLNWWDFWRDNVTLKETLLAHWRCCWKCLQHSHERQRPRDGNSPVRRGHTYWKQSGAAWPYLLETVRCGVAISTGNSPVRRDHIYWKQSGAAWPYLLETDRCGVAISTWLSNHITYLTVESSRPLTLIVLMWRIGWAHNNARKYRTGRWDVFVTVHPWYNYMNNQLDATITVD